MKIEITLSQDELKQVQELIEEGLNTSSGQRKHQIFELLAERFLVKNKSKW